MPRTYAQLRYHLVFATKRRLPLVSRELRRELYPVMGATISEHGGRMISVGGIPDHVHILFSMKPSLALSKMVQLIKGGSPNWVNSHGKSPDYFGWQEGYAAFTVSSSQISTVRHYIERQEEHHKHQSYNEEMGKLLRRHNVEFVESDFED